MCLDAEGTFQCSVVVKNTVNATFQIYSVHISKNLNVKTFLFSSSNREIQRCNVQKSRLSKLLSLFQKKLQKYNIRDKLAAVVERTTIGVHGSVVYYDD